jgi:N-acyl-D-aspartate/D-glutamate deacylase
MLGGGNGLEAGSYDAVNGRAQGKGNPRAGPAGQERADLRRDGDAELHGQSRGQSSTFNFDPAGIARLIADDRCLIGLSDGGAHVDFICDVGYATALLDLWVRQRGVLSLEKAVHKLTQVPAELFGIPNRGLLQEGKVADLVVFDPATVTAKAPKYAYDLPCNGRRLVSESEGIKATFVAGTQLYDERKHTGAMPGRILRSYE